MRITFTQADIEKAVLKELKGLSLYGESVQFDGTGNTITATVELVAPPAPAPKPTVAITGEPA